METYERNKPKYQTIMDDLIAQIERQEFSYAKPLCTEKMLSEQYGVSRITAKRAITELEHMGVLYRKRGVGSFVALNAQNVISHADRLPSGSKTVSLLLPFDMAIGGLSETIRVLHQSLDRTGHFLNLYVSDRSLKNEKKILSMLRSQDISGLIYYPITDQIHLSAINSFAMRGIPVVIMDKSTDCPYVHNVVSDNFEGGRLLTEHLLSLGHKNIAFFAAAPMETTSSVRNRFGGYLHQLRVAGLSPSPANIISYEHKLPYDEPITSREHPMAVTVKQLYDNGVTAILAENDFVASLIRSCCALLDLDVPGDLSLCGFDNLSFAESAGLTTAAQDFSLIGQSISDALLASMGDPAAPAQSFTVPVRLITRSSTRAPRRLQ